MKTSTAAELVKALGFSADETQWDELKRYANLTALKARSNGSFDLGHWWRGPLLYSLVRKYKPKTILEFGTGRGYGTLCMAKAGVDAEIPLDIYSIDLVPPDRPQKWAIDDGTGPAIKSLSINEVWSGHFPDELFSRIHLLTGNSRAIMKAWKSRGYPQPDMVFIDAGHGYMDAKHDFISAVQHSAMNCIYIFDDYTTRKNYGVNRLLDTELSPKLPQDSIEALDMLAPDLTEYGETVPHMIALLNPEGRDIPLREVYSPIAINVFNLKHLFWSLQYTIKHRTVLLLRKLGIRK